MKKTTLLIFATVLFIASCKKDQNNVTPPPAIVYSNSWTVDGETAHATNYGFMYGDVHAHTQVMHKDWSGNFAKELDLLFPKGPWETVRPAFGNTKIFTVTDTPDAPNEVSLTVGISRGTYIQYYRTVNTNKTLEVKVDTNGKMYIRCEGITVADSTATKKVDFSMKYR